MTRRSYSTTRRGSRPSPTPCDGSCCATSTCTAPPPRQPSARLLGAKTGTTSYHLRQLEKYGFIEEIPERSTGRERWWRSADVPRDIRLPTPDQLAPEDRPVLAEFHRIGMDEDRELFDRFPAAYQRDPDWAKGSRGMGRMTKEEFAEFFEAYIALLLRYSHRAEDAPPDARPLYIRLFALPADEE